MISAELCAARNTGISDSKTTTLKKSIREHGKKNQVSTIVTKVSMGNTDTPKEDKFLTFCSIVECNIDDKSLQRSQSDQFHGGFLLLPIPMADYVVFLVLERAAVAVEMVEYRRCPQLVVYQQQLLPPRPAVASGAASEGLDIHRGRFDSQRPTHNRD